ncbi:hypothetical protein [Caldovatus aquaticus]|uniref:NADH:quinone oxidoreductase/Mrp antiporter membrane subunit domain-containing protein n=1 Tax=Caldovatus aquaticus TaxID=2865671 RepID=A0ABS7F0T9_9PROT|nr:hypothetical protein [Caldovatus aquaticus]MBW8269123.1 hypothetical protein [Caldovatus aquaticus]
MTLAWLPVLVPLAAAPLAMLPGRRVGRLARLGAAALWLALALALCLLPPREGGGALRPDALNLTLLALAGAIGATAAALPAPGHGRRAPGQRVAEGAWQVFFAGVALALLADHLALAWLGLTVATLAAVAMVGLGAAAPPAALAAWRLLLAGGLGLALALFGLVLLHRATAGDAGLSWAALRLVAAQGDPRLLDLAFLCLALGQGVLAGLVLPAVPGEAEEAAPPPVAALLAGVLPLAALHGVLRAKAVVAAHPESVMPAVVLGALGIAAALLAARALWRLGRPARRPAPARVVAWAGVAQSGAAALAFGLGGVAANLAGLLLLVGQGLVRSGLRLGAGAAGAGERDDRTRAAGEALGLALLAGLPPGVLFAGQLALVAEIAARAPWLAPMLGGAMMVALAALLAAALRRFPAGLPAPGGGAPAAGPVARRAAGAMLALHLLAALLLGMAMPVGVARFLEEAARLIG